MSTSPRSNSPKRPSSSALITNPNRANSPRLRSSTFANPTTASAAKSPRGDVHSRPASPRPFTTGTSRSPQNNSNNSLSRPSSSSNLIPQVSPRMNQSKTNSPNSLPSTSRNTSPSLNSRVLSAYLPKTRNADNINRAKTFIVQEKRDAIPVVKLGSVPSPNRNTISDKTEVRSPVRPKSSTISINNYSPKKPVELNIAKNSLVKQDSIPSLSMIFEITTFYF